MLQSKTTLALSIVLPAFSAAVAQEAGLTPERAVLLRVVRSVLALPGEDTLVWTESAPRARGEPPGPARTRLWVREGADREERMLLDGSLPFRDPQLVPGRAAVSVVMRGRDERRYEVWEVPFAGGEPIRVSRTPRGVQGHRWRPDGRELALTMMDEPPARRAASRRAGFAEVVLDEQRDHSSLWVMDVGSGTLRRVTSGVTVFRFEWSPDGSRICAAVAPENSVDASYVLSRLRLIDPRAGTVETLVDNPGKLGEFAWSPDGRRVAWAGAVDRNDPSAGTLFCVDVADKRVRCLTPDLRGEVHDLEWLDDGRLVVTASFGVFTRLRRVDVEAGGLEPVTRDPDLAFRSFARIRGGFALVASTPEHPEELYVLGRDGTLTRVTDSNPELDGAALGRQEVVRYRARDGLEIEGLLIHPVDFEPGRRYPLVVVAHGGPESHFSHGWITTYSRPGQCLSARGFFAFYPNYRGSTGRGVAFAKADHGDMMGKEFQDVLDGVAELVRRGLVDPERVGIIGGSYGGYMAAWAATRKTKHFAAAVSFVPVTDVFTKTYTTDIPLESYFVHQEEQWPHDHPGEVRDRSPLTWADRCRTPLLLAGGTADTRVHPSQPLMLYRAVRFTTDTPVRYVRYPGEGHGNRIDTNRYDFCLRALRWLEHYLRPGDHRGDPPPPPDVDHSAWQAVRGAHRGG